MLTNITAHEPLNQYTQVNTKPTPYPTHVKVSSGASAAKITQTNQQNIL
jgi:hypothetical protein